MRHLLVTNDYPPKIGGIQNYLWELWRRLPPESFAVLTRPYRQDISAQTDFDDKEPYLIKRSKQAFLLPTSKQAQEIKAFAKDFKADLIIFDPALPVGDLGPKLGYPYGHIFHGAEVTIPARIPLLKQRMKATLEKAELIITASLWAEAEARKLCQNFPPSHYIPPGVDIKRFAPLQQAERQKIRESYNIDPETFLIVCVSRLVPRKGMDLLIQATAHLKKTGQDVELLIAGMGRDYKRLERLIFKTNAPARLLGKVSDQNLPELYGIGDVFSMPCRSRWGGLEQEGFGIVFIEAASCGVASIAGDSGGASEAVSEGETGIVLKNPRSSRAIAESIQNLMEDPGRLKKMGQSARARVEKSFDYDVLAKKLGSFLDV